MVNDVGRITVIISVLVNWGRSSRDVMINVLVNGGLSRGRVTILIIG